MDDQLSQCLISSSRIFNDDKSIDFSGFFKSNNIEESKSLSKNNSLHSYANSQSQEQKSTLKQNFFLQSSASIGNSSHSFGNFYKRPKDNQSISQFSYTDRSFSNNCQQKQTKASLKSSKQATKTLSLSSYQNKANTQDQLSDCDLNQNDDKQIQNYQNSLFGDIKQAVQAKSMASSSQYGSKDNFSQRLSSSVKKTQQTYEQTLKSRLNSYGKKQVKLPNNKRQKIYNHSQSNKDKKQQSGKFQNLQSRKRFSKRHLDLVARKFSDYHAYQTSNGQRGQNITLKQIGQNFQLCHNTVHVLYTEWLNDPYFYQKIKRYDRYRNRQKNPQKKLTIDRLEHITRIIKENPFLTQHQICVELNKNQDLKIIKGGKKVPLTSTLIGKLLKMAKFSKKRVKLVPKQKNTSKSLERRFDYCLKYKQIIQRKARIFFLDQSGFNLYMTRDKAWSRPNEQITVNCPISKGKRFSLIAIIGDDGLAHWRFIEGNYRKFQYLDFIRQLFQKLSESRPPEDPQQYWLILDNCAIHDKQQTINLAKQHNLNVLYLPSYSPQLNPIQNFFHQIKTKIKKINYSGQKQLFEIMQKLLAQYEDRDFTNYYHGSLKYVEKGLKKQKF